MADSFFKTLKYEQVLAFDYETVEDIIGRMLYFLQEVSNRRGPHSALGYMPPEEFENLNRSPSSQDYSLLSDCPMACVHST